MSRAPSGTRACLRLALAALVATAACGGDPGRPADAGVEGPYHIRAAPEALAVKPTESGLVTFTLLDDQERPVPDRLLQLAIVRPETGRSDPESARGATLSVDRGVTNARGEVTIQVIAGLASRFAVRASAARASDALVVVFVTSAEHGQVEVLPELQDGGSGLAALVTEVRLFFLTGGSCATVSRSAPGPGPFLPRSLPPDTPTLYASVSTADVHTLVGHAVDATGTVILDGCVDLPGRAVMAQQTVRALLPLRPLRPSPVGNFRATSVLQFRQTSEDAGAIAAAFSELTACPADPARLWLDCTVDALGPASADDPLDCRPSPGDEAAFDGRLAARRGLPAMDGTQERCRTLVDGAGRQAVEVDVARLLAEARPSLVSSVPMVVQEAVDLLRSWRLHSTLRVGHTTDPEAFQVEHRLDGLELYSTTDPIAVDLASLGLPGRVARFVAATTRRGELEIAQHGFTLRLGTVARLGFERGSLGRRALPASISGYVTALFASATLVDGGSTFFGCQALAALVCPLIGEPEGCLAAACTSGVTALAQELEASFAALDGQELDLLLDGTVPVVDRDGDQRADALGWLLQGPSAPGVWTGHVRARGEPIPVSGAWTADRIP